MAVRSTGWAMLGANSVQQAHDIGVTIARRQHQCGVVALFVQVDRGTGSWRTDHYIKRNGNLYPCHGLGPVAQYMSLARTEDTFDRVVSFSSPSRARALYAEANFPPDHKWNTQEFQAGDISTSIIKTVLGRTIMVQWDVQSPRPYTRHNLIQGTKGTLGDCWDRYWVRMVEMEQSVKIIEQALEMTMLDFNEGDIVTLSQSGGSELWRARVSTEVTSVPAAGNGIVAVHTDDGKIFGFDAASGERRWLFHRSAPVLSLRGAGTPVRRLWPQ